MNIKGNRFSEKIRDLAGYFLPRHGPTDYLFFKENLKFPDVSTVKKLMNKKVKPLEEGKFYLDSLVEYLEHNKFNREIALIEDGTKITEPVKYIKTRNMLFGLLPVIDQVTGIPINS